MRSITKHVAVMCLLLTLWSAVALISHHHASAGDALKCTVCVASQSTTTTATFYVVVVISVCVFAVAADPLTSAGRLIPFALSVRPPPEA